MVTTQETERKPYSSLSLRAAKPTDLPKLLTLVEDAYRGGRSSVSWKNEDHLVKGPRTSAEEILKFVSSSDSEILVLEDIGTEPKCTLAGCVLVEKHDGGQGHIGMLAVNPDMQNMGIGGKLLTAAEDHAIQQFHCTSGVMWVLSNRDELLTWYQSRGYALTGETEPFPGPETGLVQLASNLHFRVIRKPFATR